MQGRILSARLRATLAILTVTVFVTTTCAATEKVLHNFGSTGKDGHKPLASLIFDASGNLYGTTSEGGSGIEHCNTGTGGCGTAFELTPKAGGGWTEKVLHSFKANGKDGYYPSGSLIFDASGNLYGTTSTGGAHSAGTVFELTPAAGGIWGERILHNFNYGAKDGNSPQASLIFDASGNLYGTTYGGGVHGGGTVFELTPAAGGNWTERLLHSFKNDANGWAPGSTLTRGAAGSLYGTTIFGGDLGCGSNGAGCGTVFELTSKAGGGWTERALCRFNGKDGESPSSSVIFGASGSLYGTTALGGDLTCGNGYGCGTVFKLTPKAGGRWPESVLHEFNANGKDGTYPEGGLVFDASGSLYSTTYEGGALSCYYGYGCGTVFELTPTAGGGWTEKVLHTFSNNGRNGSGPVASLIFDASGNLYGTTIRGGDQSCGNSDGCGTVFEIKP
jgi:uncharacterized repeat protein (TIGR03803 family)